MTRYARAKGSKSSNERIPNDATPWHVMKQQLEENLSKNQESSGKVKSAKELLKDKDELFYCDNIGNINNDWAEFEESNANKVQKKKDKLAKKESSKEDKKSKQTKSKEENQITTLNDTKDSEFKKQEEGSKSEKKSTKKKKDNDISNNFVSKPENEKRKKRERKSESVTIDQSEDFQLDTAMQKESKKKKKKLHSSNEINETNESIDKTDSLPKKKKLKKGLLQESMDTSMQKDEKNNNTSNEQDNSQNATSESTQDVQTKLSKRQKRNMKKKSKSINEESNETSEIFNVTGNNWSTNVIQNTEDGKNDSTSHVKGNKYSSSNFENMNGPSNFSKFGQRKFDNNVKNRKRKPPKIRDDKEHKRRKPDIGPTKMMINGVEIEIVKYDGFPIKKEDAERLKDLKQKMIMKGIPKAEIDAAMKLERRKAEKALARIKKCVCFHCRKSGHNLSDCPELGAEQAGTGICFKCGSTEHTHFECKVAKATEYRYATCFICREQGHIAKQCPDNPKGVYPQGGACKICGDVTHLKKDCPDLAKEKEETAITVDTIANGNTLESLEKEEKRTDESGKMSTKQKIVKF